VFGKILSLSFFFLFFFFFLKIIIIIIKLYTDHYLIYLTIIFLYKLQYIYWDLSPRTHACMHQYKKKREREMAGNQVLVLILLTLLPISTPHTALAATSSSQITYTQYIKTACNSTLYPQLCYKSLSPYASEIKGNPQELCKTALSIALQAARNASSTVSNLRQQKTLTPYESSVIKDCVVNIKDSIDELKQSLQAMDRLSGSDKEFQLSNIKTWVSAALTDENTCNDGLDEGGQKISAAVKNKIRNSILIVARLTSNALALINNLKI
jgi:pectinesterase inhibitor-like protein